MVIHPRYIHTDIGVCIFCKYELSYEYESCLFFIKLTILAWSTSVETYGIFQTKKGGNGREV